MKQKLLRILGLTAVVTIFSVSSSQAGGGACSFCAVQAVECNRYNCIETGVAIFTCDCQTHEVQCICH
jgi:hypothetical protein